MGGHGDRIYARYSEVRPHYPVPTNPTELLSGADIIFGKFLISPLPARKDVKILDIGCGCGRFVHFL